MMTAADHPTPDPRRTEAQATAAFDSQQWPGLDIDRIHRAVDVPAERHAELVQTIRLERQELCWHLTKLFIGAWVTALFVLLAYFLTAGVAPSSVRAQETRIVLHQVSYHFDRSQQFNEVNPGLGVQYRPFSASLPSLGDERAAPLAARALASGYVQAGFYKNSVNRNTAYAVLGSEPFSFGLVRLGAALGVASGYRERHTTVTTTTPPPLQACRKNERCVIDPPITTTTTVRTPRGGVVPLVALTASLPMGERWTAHAAITPTVKTGGITHNYGAIALVLSARI